MLGAVMSRDLSLVKLRRVDAGLRKSLTKVALIGQLSNTSENYLRLAAEVRKLIAGKEEWLSDVPDAVLLALMVFCARYEDTALEGYWAPFLRCLGLPNEPRLQNACRARFKEARANLCRSYPHLYFPAEGYAYVTPILYHAIIPQACVPEMAQLLRGIGQAAGWEAVALMELAELEAQLPTVASRMKASRTLTRFIVNENSRRLAARLVHDLCDAAYLHQRGEWTLGQVRFLLTDHPVQRELWERMMDAPEKEVRAAKPHALFVMPRWQWDIRARRLRLFFPRQVLSGGKRPAVLAIKQERYPIEARPEGSGWQIEPLCLVNVPVAWSAPSGFNVEMRADDGQCLRHWKITPPSDSALFFQLNSAGTVASFVNPEKGLTPGESLVLLRQQLRLYDENGEVEPSFRERVPQGFKAEYQAILVQLQPPVRVFAASDDEEWLRRYSLLAESAPPLRHVVYSCRSYLIPRAAGFLIAGSTTEHTGFEKATSLAGIASIVERSCEIAPSLVGKPPIETWAGLRPKICATIGL